MLLSWTDNSGNEANFELSWGTDGITFATGSLTPAANTNIVTVTGLAAETTYYFRIRAVNAFGNSAYATSGAATTAPAAPSGLYVDARTSSTMTIRWTDNTTIETAYSIQRSDAGGAYSVVGGEAADATVFIDTALLSNTLYAYKVNAVGTNGTSDDSNIASDTTDP